MEERCAQSYAPQKHGTFTILHMPQKKASHTETHAGYNFVTY